MAIGFWYVQKPCCWFFSFNIKQNKTIRSVCWKCMRVELFCGCLSWKTYWMSIKDKCQLLSVMAYVWFFDIALYKKWLLFYLVGCVWLKIKNVPNRTWDLPVKYLLLSFLSFINLHLPSSPCVLWRLFWERGVGGGSRWYSDEMNCNIYQESTISNLWKIRIFSPWQDYFFYKICFTEKNIYTTTQKQWEINYKRCICEIL